MYNSNSEVNIKTNDRVDGDVAVNRSPVIPNFKPHMDNLGREIKPVFHFGSKTNKLILPASANSLDNQPASSNLPYHGETLAAREDKLNETNNNKHNNGARDSSSFPSSPLAADTSNTSSSNSRDVTAAAAPDDLVFSRNVTVAADDGAKTTQSNTFKVPDDATTLFLDTYRSPGNSKNKKKCVGASGSGKTVSPVSHTRTWPKDLGLLNVPAGKTKDSLIDMGEFASDFSSYVSKLNSSSACCNTECLWVGEQLRTQGMAIVRRRIFSYLPAMDLLRCQRVCKLWQSETEAELNRRPYSQWHTEYDKDCSPAGQARVWDNVNTFLKELWFPAAHVLMLTTRRTFTSMLPQSSNSFLMPFPQEDASKKIVRRMASNLPDDCVISGAVTRTGLTGTSSDLADPVTFEGWEMAVTLFVVGRRSNLKLVPGDVIRNKPFPVSGSNAPLVNRTVPSERTSSCLGKKQNRASAICFSASASDQMDHLVKENVPIIFALGPRPYLESFWYFGGKFEKGTHSTLQCLGIKGTGVSQAVHLARGIFQPNQIVNTLRDSYDTFAQNQLKTWPGRRPLLAIQRVAYATCFNERSVQGFHHMLRMCNGVFRDAFPSVPLLGALSGRGSDPRQDEVWRALIKEMLGTTQERNSSPADANGHAEEENDSVAVRDMPDLHLIKDRDSAQRTGVHSGNASSVTKRRVSHRTTGGGRQESGVREERLRRERSPSGFSGEIINDFAKEGDGAGSDENENRNHKPSRSDVTSENVFCRVQQQRAKRAVNDRKEIQNQEHSRSDYFTIATDRDDRIDTRRKETEDYDSSCNGVSGNNTNRATREKDVIVTKVLCDVSNGVDVTGDDVMNTSTSRASVSKDADQTRPSSTRNDEQENTNTCSWRSKGVDAEVFSHDSHAKKFAKNNSGDDLSERDEPVDRSAWRGEFLNRTHSSDERSDTDSGIPSPDPNDDNASTSEDSVNASGASYFSRGRLFSNESSDGKRVDLSDADSDDEFQVMEIGYSDYDDCCFDLCTLFIFVNDD